MYSMILNLEDHIGILLVSRTRLSGPYNLKD